RINLSLALAALGKLGIVPSLNILQKLSPPPGRFNVITCASNEVIIDYAHTPDAIENITEAIRFAYPEKKLVIIFGCGGNRDRSKRPLMGKAAALYTDKVVITTDNPRDEQALDIINDIKI